MEKKSIESSSIMNNNPVSPGKKRLLMEKSGKTLRCQSTFLTSQDGKDLRQETGFHSHEKVFIQEN